METFFQQLILCIGAVAAAFASDSDLEKRVKHDYANSNGVKIHYVSLGEGPLVVMLHGFPDFWYTWRHQMEVLSKNHKVVAHRTALTTATRWSGACAGSSHAGVVVYHR